MESCFNDSLNELILWSSWDNCSEMCELNYTISTTSSFTCLNASNCPGYAIEAMKDCSFEEACPEYLSQWSLWDDCRESCENHENEPVQRRSRECLRDDNECSNAVLTEEIDCSDCRTNGCEGPYHICKQNTNCVYDCYCNFSSYADNGTCKDCQNDCMNGLKKCRYIYDQGNECVCIPNYLLVNEKCSDALSEWNSWTSWIFVNYNTTRNRDRTCLLFVDANTNETQECTDTLSEWSSWSDCLNATNRTRGRTCGDEYFGKNCSGTVVEQIQLCPSFVYTIIIIQLNKPWSNDYFDSSSKIYKDSSSWVENFNNNFKNWFERLSRLTLFTSRLVVDNFMLLSTYDIWYPVEKKDLFDSCKKIESYLANQVQIFNRNISNFFIFHSDCCFSKLLPEKAFILKYFTGLKNLNLSLANVNSTLRCKYGASKSFNVSCVTWPEYAPDLVWWSYDTIYNCPAENSFSQSLIDLNKNITKLNAGKQAARFSSLLNKTTNLSVFDMESSTQIITRIVKASTMPSNVTTNILLSVSSLLNQNKSLFNEADSIFNTSRNLLFQLDQMAKKQSKTYSISTKNLAFSSYFHKKKNSNVYIYSVYNNNISKIVISNNYPKNNSKIYPYITLPSQLFLNKSNTMVYSYKYKEVDLFVNMKNSTETINSDVLSVTLKDIPVNKSNNSILLMFTKHSNTSGNTSCGFFKTNERIWSTDGCNVAKTTSSVIICECNHLTNFALLLNVAQSVPSQSQENTLGLTIVTWIGCGLSIAGLFFTIVSYSAFPKLRKKLAPKILLSLCVSLISTLIIFVALVDRTKPRLLCQIVASLLQFFVLSTFFWMAIEGINLYRMFVKVFQGSSSSRIFLLKASAFAWGIPLVFTIVTAASKPDLLGPGNSTVGQICVVRGYPFFFGILLPICVIMAGNICFLFFVLRGIGGDSKLNNKIDCKKKVRIAFACSVLLGLTWIFAILAVGKATAVFQWLFCIFNSLQGFYIFLFYTVENKQVKEEWMLFLQKRFGCFKTFVPQKLQSTTSGSVGNTFNTKIE